MAYQDVKPGRVTMAGLALPKDPTPDDIVELLRKLAYEHVQLAQEVRECHKRIQQFTAPVGNGLTTSVITLAIPAFTTGYQVSVEAPFNTGGWWVGLKSTTGFTLTWVNATAGSQTFRFLVVE